MASAAGNLRYNSRSAVYGDLAYDLDRELRERELRHAGEMPRRQEKAVERPKVRSVSQVQVRQRQHVSLLSVAGFGAVAVLAVVVLMSYIQLTVLSSQTVELQNQLSDLQTENMNLSNQYEQMFDLDAVKAASEAAGMSRPTSGQIDYIDLSDGDTAVVYQQEEPGLVSQVLSSLNHGVYAVVEYFD